jgi:hypothetical protein
MKPWQRTGTILSLYQRICYACGVYKTFMNLVLGCLLCKHECKLCERVILVQILSRVYQLIGDDFTIHTVFGSLWVCLVGEKLL